MSKIYVGSVGTEIVLDCGSDISGANLVRIYARKPSGERVTWSAIVVDQTQVSHVTLPGEINEAGVWKLQAYVEEATWAGRGETYDLHVYNAFE